MIRNKLFRLCGSAASATLMFLFSSACLVSGISAQSADLAKAGSPLRPNTPSTFLAAPSFPLGFPPSSMATGNLTQSGKLDLVTADYNSGKITVFLGVGQGNFAPGAAYDSGLHPTSVVVADINGDGRADVLVCNEHEGTISVLLGSGNGKLSLPRSYTVGFDPSFIAVGDFNGNGKTDVAVAGTSGKLLAILLNDGNGNLTKPVLYSLAKTPTALTVADFNNDGRTDLALANADGTVSVLLGQGGGVFHPLPDFNVSLGSLSSIVSGDFNKDGKVDLAVTQPGHKSVSVLLGKGDGTFASPASYRVGNQPVSTLAADVDGDGAADLIVINKSSNTFSVLVGNGDGTFKSSLDFVAGNAPVAAVAGDFYGNGHVDLAIINQSSQTMTIPLGNGDGTFKAGRSYSAGQQPVSIASGNLNGNKIPGLVVANYCGSDASCNKPGSVSVFLADDKGVYRLSSTYSVGAGPVSVALADVNGDKNLDIIALNRLDKTVSVLLGAGDGTFRQPMTFPLASAPIAVAADDFNKDGKPDLAVLEDCGSAKCAQPGSLEILVGGGDGSFQSALSYPAGYSPSSVAVGDIKGDKNLDILVANRCGKDASCQSPGTATVLIGDGTGRFTPGADIALGNSPSSIFLGNLSGPGVLDLVVSRSTDNTVAVLHGKGDGSFQPPVPYQVGAAPGPVVVADFNGDGKPDVAVTNFNDSTVSVLFGHGDGTLQAAVALPVAAGPESLTAVGGTSGGHASLATANGNSGSATVGTEVTTLANIQPYALLTPTVTLSASPTPSSNVNASVLLTAVVSGSGATPTQTVTFNSGTSISDCANPVTLDGTGTATCSTSVLQAGSDSLTADYSGDGVYTPGTSNTVAQTVNALTPTFSVTSPGASNVNASVTFTAQLAGVAFTPIAPAGMVNFTANGTTITGCGAVPVDATGKATCSTSSLVAPSDPITATYSGDPNFTVAAPAAMTQTVNALTPTFGVTSPGASNVNASVTFTAQLAGVAFTPVVPSGKVNFTANGTTITGCGAVSVDATGKATCSTSSLVAPSDPITATYSGDPNFTVAAPGTLTQTVNPLAATLGVTSPGASNVNASVTFTAQLAGVAFTPVVPSGKVDFTANGTTITGCGAVAVDATGKATCSTSSLVAPSDPITATYSGDVNFTVAAPAAMTQTVNALAATLGVTSPGASNVNASVTFTAQLAGVAFTPIVPAGKVNFTANGTTITGCGAVAVDATGKATCSTSSLVAPSDPITAIYSGDTNFTVATPGTMTQTVNALTPTFSVTSPGASNVNASVTFTAQLAGVAFTPVAPSGKVNFTANGTTITGCGAVSVDATGKATCSTSSLVAPSDPITAIYSGDNNFTVAAPAAMTQTVNALTATLNLTPAPSASVPVGTTVTFTAQLAGVALTPVTPNGTVTFTINGSSSSDCPAVKVNATGAATCITASLVVPADVIVATYSGDTNFTVAAPTTITETVGKAAATTTLGSVPASPSVNQPVTFTATVQATSGTVVPTGSVTFTQGATQLCAPAALTVNATNATATCNYAFTSATAGSTITATYSGDSNFAAGAPGTHTEVVTSTGTVTGLSSIPSTSTVNQQVAFTATVTPTFTGTAVPKGTVTFTNTSTATVLCTQTVASNGTVPVCNFTFASAPAAGFNNVVAAFTSSDSNFVSSASATYKQTVGPTATTTTVAAVPSTSVVNQMVIFTATITPSFTGPTNPTGTVAFTYSLNGGSSVNLCASPQSVSTTAGVTTAVCTASLPSNGNYVITALYATGDTNFTGSQGTTPQAVGLTATTTTVGASASTSTVNQAVTFTATVTPSTTGSTNPSGTVTFSYTNSIVTTPANLCPPKAVSTTAGITTATCLTTLPAAAVDTIKATYSGDTNFGTSVVTATETVNTTATTTTVSASPSSSTVNQPVTFTATVTPAIAPFAGSTNPGGTVAFSYTLGGGPAVNLCTSVAVNTTSEVTTAACTAALPTPGSYTVTAAYSGDTNFVAGSGSAVQPVALTGTTTTVVGSPSSSTVNQPVTFTATVTPAIIGSVNPSGSVAFSYTLGGGSSVSLCASAAVSTLGTITTASCTSPLPSQGTYTITAAYSGDVNFKPGPGSTTQFVAGTTTTTALIAAPSPAAVNQPVLFTATVTPSVSGSTNPTGTVAFSYVLNGGSPVNLCAAASVTPATGISTCNSSLPAQGTYKITAAYNGDTNFVASSSSPLNLTVNPANLTLAVTSSLASSLVNQSVTFTATLTLANSGAAQPTSTVAFVDTLTGSTLCSSAPLAVVSAKVFTASCILPATAQWTAATHAITATYGGDPNFPASTSPVFSQVVGQTPTTVALTSSLPASVATQSVTFTATVTPMLIGAVVPSGYFTFTSSSVAWIPAASCQAAAVAPVTTGTGAGSAIATCTASFPVSAGSQTISAVYSTDPNFTGNGASISQTIQNFSIANSVTAAGSTASTAGPVTLTQGYSTATSSTGSTDPFNPSTVKVAVTSTGGFTDPLKVTCVVTNSSSAVVTDPSCSLSSGAALSGKNGTQLIYTLGASASAPIGAYNVALTAVDSSVNALSQSAAPLTVYVVGVANTLSLAQGASGTENASFNTATLPSPAKAPTTLSSFTCGTVWNTATGAQVPTSQLNGLSCTGPSSAPVTGVNTSVAISISTSGTTTAQLQRSSTIYAAAFLGIPLLALLGWVGGKKSPRRTFFRFIGLILLVAGVSSATGCGGSFTYPKTPANNAIAAGNYLVEVIGTDQNGNKYYAVIPLDVSSNTAQ